MMQWSHYSKSLFDAYTNSSDNLIVQACPGAGKTTNIKHLWSLDNKPTCYLVFNKHNQLSADAQMPKKQGSNVLTLNGLGHRCITSNVGRVTVDDSKVMSIIKNHIHYASKHRRYAKWDTLKRVVKMAKSHLLSDDIGEREYQDMLDMYDLDSYDGMRHDLVKVLGISDNIITTIDYNDQLRLPVIHNMHMQVYSNVLGDEVQDFNPLQAKLVSMIDAERYVFVGDRHQSVYGFRGAMNDSMLYLKEHFNCVELPLSITYRCPQAVVQQAAEIYDDIEVWDQAEGGTVYSSLDHTSLTYDMNTLVLCRMNRPLISLAFTLLKQGVACHVRGRDIGEGMVRLIKRQEAQSISQLIDRMSEWKETEVYKAQIKGDEHKLQSVHDKYDSVMLFCEQVSLHEPVDVVISKISELFEQGRGVCLSTVHKAKGLEADRCYLLDYPLFDLFAAKQRQPWQFEQERNIKYVAVTRAKQELVYM